MSHKYSCDLKPCLNTKGAEDWFNQVVYHLSFGGEEDPPHRSPTGIRQFHWKCLKKYMAG